MQSLTYSLCRALRTVCAEPYVSLCRALRTVCAEPYVQSVQSLTYSLCRVLRSVCAEPYVQSVQSLTYSLCRALRTVCAAHQFSTVYHQKSQSSQMTSQNLNQPEENKDVQTAFNVQINLLRVRMICNSVF